MLHFYFHHSITVLTTYETKMISNHKPKYEGFWRDTADAKYSDLPFPQTETHDWGGSRFLIMLHTIEQTAIDPKGYIETQGTCNLGVTVEGYMGISNCRICDCYNSNLEYTAQLDGEKYVWPAGFSHYIQEHNVKPTDDFRQFITLKYVEITGQQLQHAQQPPQPN